jgi:uncharacterized protein
MTIKITIGKLTVFCTLNASQTAKLIWNSLPLTSKSELWGEEVYFYIQPKTGIEKAYACDEVQPGDLAYWPTGPCMCLFFGLTPNSRAGKIIPVSTVNVFGSVEGDPLILSIVKEGQPIKVERALSSL